MCFFLLLFVFWALEHLPLGLRPEENNRRIAAGVYFGFGQYVLCFMPPVWKGKVHSVEHCVAPVDIWFTLFFLYWCSCFVSLSGTQTQADLCWASAVFQISRGIERKHVQSNVMFLNVVYDCLAAAGLLLSSSHPVRCLFILLRKQPSLLSKHLSQTIFKVSICN